MAGSSIYTLSKAVNFGACQHALTYAQNVAWCGAMGARLCTRAELQADCTAGTGCGHDGDLVWSSDSDLTIAVAEAKSVEAGEKGTHPLPSSRRYPSS